MNFPKISIVTPVFNRVEYLEQTILSVIDQGYPNLEYIVIDGGSTDGTLEIIKKYEDRIFYWTSEPDNGMYDAINKGFKKASGQIMAWINSDDLYHQRSLFSVAGIFNDLPDVDWIFGMPAFYNHNHVCVKITKSRGWSKERFFIGDYKWIQQENVFWRRSLWEKSGGLGAEYKYAGDLDLWSRFFHHSVLHNVETSFAGFRLHGNQLSITGEKTYLREAELVYKAVISRYFKKGELAVARSLYNRISAYRNSRPGVKRKLAALLSVMLEKRINAPGLIYYDFSDHQWKK